MFREISGENVVIYQDTDSIYISLESFVNKFIPELIDDTDKIVDFLDKFAKKKIEPFLESVFEDISSKMGCASNYIHMKREAIATTGIWLSKKRYLLNLMDNEGYRYETPELKMLGVDAVKSSTPKLVRDALSKTFPIILSGDKESTENFINSFRDEFYSADISEIAFPRSVNNLQKYQDSVTIFRQDIAVPIHVRATLMYNYLLDKHKLDQNRYRKIPSGSKIKYCYLRIPNPSKQHVIGFESHLPIEFGLHKFIDYETQFEKTYIASVMNVLEAIGWEDILSDTNSIF
jgi:DNA polymerase elongation subunit (family B)